MSRTRLAQVHRTALAPVRRRLAGASETTRRFLGGMLWTIGGTSSRRLLSGVSTIAVARILGPERFGEFSMIQSTVSVFGTYAAFRLGSTATKYIAEFRGTDPARAARVMQFTMTLSLLLCLTAAAALSASSGILAREALGNSTLSGGLTLGGLLVFLTYVDVQQAALAGFENFKAMARVNLVWGLASLCVAPPLAYYRGVDGVILGLSLAGLLALLTTSRALRQSAKHHAFPRRLALAELRQELPILWSFALPGFLLGSLTVVAMWGGKALLTHQPDGYRQLGLFGAMDQFRALVLFLPSIIARVMLPILSETHGRKDVNDMSRLLSIQLRVVIITALPLACLLLGFTGLLPMIYGARYQGAEPVLSILMLSVFLAAINQPLSMVFSATGTPWQNLGMYVGWAVLYGGLCYVLIPDMGGFGLATAMLAADLVLLLLQAVYIDLVLLPRALRKLSKLFFFSFVVLAGNYISGSVLGADWRLIAASLLTLASLLPAVAVFWYQSRRPVMNVQR